MNLKMFNNIWIILYLRPRCHCDKWRHYLELKPNVLSLATWQAGEARSNYALLSAWFPAWRFPASWFTGGDYSPDDLCRGYMRYMTPPLIAVGSYVSISTCLHIHLSEFPSVSIPTCLKLYLSPYPPVSISICLHIHLSQSLPDSISTCLNLHLSPYPPVSIFTWLNIHLYQSSSVSISTCLNLHLSQYHLSQYHLSQCPPVSISPVSISPVSMSTCLNVHLSPCPSVSISTCTHIYGSHYPPLKTSKLHN
jgi:hypothetical protein